MVAAELKHKLARRIAYAQKLSDTQDIKMHSTQGHTNHALDN